MNPERELTILLALKDRVPFTRRWMAYANRVRLPFHVCIADGGSDDASERMLADRAAFPHVSYEYARYPRDTSYTDYWTKVADALSRVRTEFVALIDNDDLVVVSGARRAVDFLAAHPDHASCGGQCAIFWVTPGGGDADERLCYGSDVRWKYSLDAHSLAQDTARARIRHHSRRATNTAHYHVRRTAELRRQAEIIRDLDIKDPFVIERLLFFLTATAGKIEQLDTVYIARQWNAPGSDGLAHEAKYGDWLGRMLSPSWSRDFTNFVRVASEALADADRIPLDEARRSVVELYRMWVAPQMLGDVLAEPTVTLSMPIVLLVVHRLLGRSPDSMIRRLARAAYRRTRWISVDALHATELRARRVADADAAFLPIRAFLTGGSRPGV